MKHVALLSFAIAILAPSLAAQTPDPPTHLIISTASGRDTFYMGERVVLTLSFTGPNDESYAVNTTLFDRSGRVSHDTFNIEPSSGTRNPLGFLMMGGFGGGPQSSEPLTSKPTSMRLNLNEWVRIDRPGDYRLSITSQRTGLADRMGLPSSINRLSITSNAITLHVTAATPEWQAKTLTAIKAGLATPLGDKFAPLPQPYKDALADLRYLGSPDAIKLLAARLRSDLPYDKFELRFGLIGLPQSSREFALAAMKERIEDPGFPVSDLFLDTHSKLRISENEFPLSPPEEGEPYEKTKALYDAYEKRLAKLSQQTWALVASNLERKRGEAAVATATALGEDIPADATPGERAHVAEILRANFTGLTGGMQSMLLHQSWQLFDSSEFLPALRAALEHPGKEDGYWADYMSTIGLVRWYQLDPASGLKEIIRRISVPTPSLSARDLSFLPETTTFPQLQRRWAEAIEHAPDHSSEADDSLSLLLRFGDATLTPTMVGLASRKKAGCSLHAAAMSYLLRFSPEQAHTFISAAELEPKSPCGDSFFSRLNDPGSDPALIALAIQTLSTSNPANIKSALEYLQKYGDASARKPVLDFFLAWAARQKGPADLDDREEMHRYDEVFTDRRLKDSLIRPLLTAQGWVPDTELIHAALTHCFGRHMCDEAKFLSSVDHKVRLNLDTISSFSLDIDYYSTSDVRLFEKKIQQYPRGTNFILERPYTSSDLSASDEARIESLFTSNGMTLTRVKP